MIEDPAQQPIQNVPRAYPYAQYSDDPNVSAFFTAYTQIAQGYLEWFNQNCLGIYTDKSGPLLDWIGTNLYGLPRPVVGTQRQTQQGAIGTFTIGTQAIGINKITRNDIAQPVGDDIYKRYLTMWLYMGDGKQMSIDWIRRRVARFLFGANGSDVPVQDLQKVSVAIPLMPRRGAIGTFAIGTQAIAVLPAQTKYAAHSLNINIPVAAASTQFQLLFNAGLVPLPFQINFSVTIGGNYMLGNNGSVFILNSSELG